MSHQSRSPHRGDGGSARGGRAPRGQGRGGLTQMPTDLREALDRAHNTPCTDYLTGCPRGYRCQYLHQYELFNDALQAISTDILIGMNYEMLQNQRVIINLLRTLTTPGEVLSEEQLRQERGRDTRRRASITRSRSSVSRSRASSRSSTPERSQVYRQPIIQPQPPWTAPPQYPPEWYQPVQGPISYAQYIQPTEGYTQSESVPQHSQASLYTEESTLNPPHFPR
ncbi:hypothetical protein [Blattodean arli-related virus OKIAV101]|uniref:C3H1-type domain-containing protein n=1 Tax=Blattodean arli-related virus OKIAV101 TaxID=2746351 RepID=A0A7D7F8A1_9MONO|nr:hypothetical protein [Blattodean arli-related virus OKIAV101]